MKPTQQESGQALLIILLSMAVVITIVLSIVSRSVTDVRTSSKEQDSLRAFSAAEAGIERALVSGGNSSGPIGGATFNANVTEVARNASVFSYPNDLTSGDPGTIWFVSHKQDGSLGCDASNPCFAGSTVTLCWGNSGAIGATTPAIEATFIYTSTPGDYTTSKVSRASYDPNVARRATNGFGAPDVGNCVIGTKTYPYRKTINLVALPAVGGLGIVNANVANVLQLLRVRMLYNTVATAPFGVTVPGGSVLPSQGRQIESTGVSGDSTRKVQVFSLYSDLPSVFSSGIFSEGGINQ